MKLGELIEVINENSVVNIFDTENSFIGFYDGKDSIQKELNDHDVISISSTYGIEDYESELVIVVS